MNGDDDTVTSAPGKDPELLEGWVREVLEEELDREYLVELARLQVELLKLQTHLVATSRRVAILFEGRDTAGKGGTIQRFSQRMMPRHQRVVALPKPTEMEMGQWYFGRYIAQLPNPGEIVFFDRSWYNRAVVEPVMGFCTAAQYERFMEQVVVFEQMLLEDGLLLVKLWFSIDRVEQHDRLARRQTNPLKRWKLSTVDLQAQQKWEAFTRYKEAMFARTSTASSPWYVIEGNDKKQARLESIRHVLGCIDYPDRGQRGLRLEPRPEVVRRV
ncbi:polyphosphate kinase 2 [Engelhardtia mirabilis]|uniref:ADP/GDP-polyphosphate phosphotransferase n=1 Tax=Engelhardtia mirabilis TaxID=2528011 RepID=A0A518BE03_9BACT|nr:Polyphosphate kinase 2 (PPK2) [Planctomycetes bacterium Pla133]QDU99541.1 Polyphosphate kinase 2 (PPK2) [Planctomycetes bacterium Pla86]